MRAVICALAGLVLAVVACEETDSHVFGGRRYDATAKCVASAYSPIEVVDGDGTDSNCPNRCVRFTEHLYITTVCGPLPSGAADPGVGDPECADALVAPSCEAATEPTADAGSDAGH